MTNPEKSADYYAAQAAHESPTLIEYVKQGVRMDALVGMMAGDKPGVEQIIGSAQAHTRNVIAVDLYNGLVAKHIPADSPLYNLDEKTPRQVVEGIVEWIAAMPYGAIVEFFDDHGDCSRPDPRLN